MPVEEFVRDFPFPIAVEQREYVGSPGVGSRQLAGPVLHFQMNDGDRLDDFNAREARGDIRRRTIFVDPLEHVLYRARVFDSLAVAGDGGGRMKGRTHEIAVASARPGDIAMHGTSDGIVFDEISVGRFCRRETGAFVDYARTGALGS